MNKKQNPEAAENAQTTSIPAVDLPPLPEKPPAAPSQPLPRDEAGNIKWEIVLADLDYETVMIVPDHFQQDITILAALSGVCIATAPARKGSFALMRVHSQHNVQVEARRK